MKRGEKLLHYMEVKGFNTSSLAKESGVAYTTIRSMIENDLKNSSIDNVIKLSRTLGIQVEDLITDDNSSVRGNNKSNEYPYFPIGISAGLPINVEPINASEIITIPDEMLGKYAGSKGLYFTKVNGDSMNKVFPDKSLIAVKQVEPHELKNGDIVVYSNGYDYSVKRFYDIGNKLVFKPESTDPSFTDHIIEKTSEDLRLHGKVVTYIVNVD